MTRLQKKNIVRKEGDCWAVFYSGTSEIFENNFSTIEDAESYFYSLPKFDQMIISRQPPGTSGTDRAFLQATDNGRQFQSNTEAGRYYKREALKRGKKISRGHVYKATLARYPGDPRAWVSDLGEAKKVIEQRELEETKKEAAGPPPEIDVADRIVNEQTALALAGQTVTGREYKDMREKVKNRLRPSWKKKK